MSQETLDLKRSLHIVRRHRKVVGAVAAVGLLAGVAYGFLDPPKPTSSALVVLAPATKDVPTQVVIAGSQPVLQGALSKIKPRASLTSLQHDVQVANSNPDLITISAQGQIPAQAESTANAVANSYVAFVKTGAEVQAQAKLLEPATTATSGSLPLTLLIDGGIGALMGAVIGAIAVLALNRGDRRLRERDEIANAIGVPVLASIPVEHPANAGRWTRLLEDYEPSIGHAWQLRSALRYLGESDAMSTNGSSPNGSSGDGFSLAVLSLSSDPGALALGPQLAVFAASLGIPTALVIDPRQEETNATAALRAACAAPPSPRRSGQLHVVVADPDDTSWREPGVKLTVMVAVVDERDPRVADTVSTGATVLGISSGEATGAQLARVAFSAADDGRQIDGILVADPDAADHTTGRIPQLARPPRRRLPTRLTGTPTETRR